MALLSIESKFSDFNANFFFPNNLFYIFYFLKIETIGLSKHVFKILKFYSKMNNILPLAKRTRLFMKNSGTTDIFSLIRILTKHTRN